MKRFAVGLLVVFMGVGLAQAGAKGPEGSAKGNAALSRPHVAKTDNTIQFRDKSGRAKKEIQLRKNSREGEPPKKYGFPPGATVRLLDEETAFISPNQKYVGILHEEGIAYYEGSERQTTFRLLDMNGDILWQKENVVSETLPSIGVRFSSDGSRILLVTGDVPSSVTATRNLVNIYALDGSLVWSLGEFQSVSDTFLTSNGRYGYVRASPLNKNKDEWIFFNIDSKTTKSIDFGFGENAARIDDNGQIEFIQYDLSQEKLPADGKLKERIIKTLKIK